MTDYDPEQVAIRPAATVMIVDDRPDLQVFMMERHAETVFAGGMWVFPGGSVDQTDRNADDISIHRTDREASELMGLSKGGLAYYIAAIREAFEEAGILLALHRQSMTRPDFTDVAISDRFQDHRDALNAQKRDFLDIVSEEDLIIDGGAMHYIARWITPVGPPRRFDARFFIAQMPHDQTPIHDDGELVHSRWLSPEVILKKVEEEKMVLMTPTLRMVKNLAQFSSAEEVITAAAANLPDHRARVGGEDNTIVMPGEPGYETAAQTIESGWVRLRPL